MRDLTTHMQSLLSNPIYIDRTERRRYTCIEDIPLCNENTVNLSTCQPSDTAQIQKTSVNLRQPSSTFTPGALSDHLLSRLQAGSRWLTSQHQVWLDDEEDAASDERFSVALEGWDEMERSLRMVYGYQGCIYGPQQRCPEDGVISCDGCRR